MSGQSISRRSFLQTTAVAAGALAVGQLGLAQPAAAATTFYKGADISWVPQLESQGTYWRNASGVRQDILTILKGYGLVRDPLAHLVNPPATRPTGTAPSPRPPRWRYARRTPGWRSNIDYMFGDTWNSVGVQNPPAAWKNMSYSQMLSAMNSYVNQTMNVIKNAGVLPTWVQIGNEINSGICHPVGSVANRAQMTGLLNAAHDEVKQVFPSAIV